MRAVDVKTDVMSHPAPRPGITVDTDGEVNDMELGRKQQTNHGATQRQQTDPTELPDTDAMRCSQVLDASVHRHTALHRIQLRLLASLLGPWYDWNKTAM